MSRSVLNLKLWSRLIAAGTCLTAALGLESGTRVTPRPAYAVAFSPRGDRLAALTVGESTETVKLWVWEVETGRQLSSITIGDRSVSLTYDPNSSMVATGGLNGTVELRDSADGRVIRSYIGHITPVRTLAFLHDGATLAAGSAAGTVILWDVATGVEQRRFERGNRYPVNGMAISSDGRTLAATGGFGSGAMGLWDIDSGQTVNVKSLRAGIDPIAFVPGQMVLAARVMSPTQSIILVDCNSDLPVASIPVNHARSLDISSDGRLVAVGGDDEMVTVREVPSGRILATFGGHLHASTPLSDALGNVTADVGLTERRVQHTVWAVAFSPDGTRLASCGHDGSVWLWGVPGNSAASPPDRLLLARVSRPDWLRPIQAVLALMALTIMASAVLVGFDRAKKPASLPVVPKKK